jgi:hypothetical protein
MFTNQTIVVPLLKNVKLFDVVAIMQYFKINISNSLICED